MKTSKILVTLAAMILSTNVSMAKEWGKTAFKAYKKTEAIGVQIDMSKTQIMGLDSTEFVTYYAESNGGTAKATDLILKRFRNLIIEAARKKCDKSILYPSAPCKERLNMLMEFDNITDHAGVTGTLYLYDNTDVAPRENAMKYKVRLEDGRWNEFEKLLYEAAEKLGEALEEVVSNPKSDNKIIKKLK